MEVVNAMFQGIDGNTSDADAEENGTSSAQPAQKPVVEKVDKEEQYIDEDRLTTVTVEAVDVSRDGLTTSTLHHPSSLSRSSCSEDSTHDEQTSPNRKHKHDAVSSLDNRPKKEPGDQRRTRQVRGKDTALSRPTKRKKAFRYESKAERRLDRFKQSAAKKKQREKREKREKGE